MEAAKLPQRKFKSLRLISISLLLLVVFVCLSIVVLLNSKSVQTRVFDKFVAPELAKYNLEIEFNGFHYLFPNTIVIPPVEASFKGQPLVKTGQISLKEFFYQSGILGGRELLLDDIHLLQPLDSALLEDFSLAFADSTESTGAMRIPFDLKLGQLEVQNIRGEFFNRPTDLSIVVEQLTLDDLLSVESIHSTVHMDDEDFALSIDSVDSNLEEQVVNASYEILYSNVGWLNGNMYFSPDSLSSTGTVITEQSPSSKLLSLGDYSDFISSTTLNYELQSFGQLFLAEFNASSVELEMAGHVEYQIDNGRASVFADFYPNKLFYDKALFADYRSALDIFSPQTMTVGLTTDFKDEFSLNLVGVESSNKISVVADKLSEPARLEADFHKLDLGPLKEVRLKTALVPSISSAFNGEAFSIHGVSPMLRMEKDTVRGLSFSFNHTTSLDSIWLSCLDENLNVEGQVRLSESNIAGEMKLHSAGLFLFDELDTGQFLSANLSIHSDYNLRGELTLENILLQRTSDVVFMRKFNVQHSVDQQIRDLSVQSDVLNANMKGHWETSDLSSIARQIGQHVLIQEKPNWVPASLDFKMDAGNINWLTDLFHIDGFISPDSHIQGVYDGLKQKWSLDANVPKARFEEFGIEGLVLNSGQIKSTHHTTARLRSLVSNGAVFDTISLNLRGYEDLMNLAVAGVFQDSIPTKFNFEASYGPSNFQISRGLFNIGNSDFQFLPNGRFAWTNNTLSIDSVGFKGENGLLIFHGSLLEDGKDVLRVHLEDLQSPIFNYLLRTEGLEIEGTLSGLISVQHTLSEPVVFSNFDMVNLGLNGYKYGHLNFGARYTKDKNIIAQGQIRDKGQSSISFGATVYGVSNEIDARVSLDDFALDGFNPLLGGVLDELHGRLQGGLSVYGPIDDWNIGGSAQLRNGHFTIPVVGAELATAEPAEIEITNSRITLDPTNFIVPDDGTRAKAWGSIRHDKFDDFNFDLRFHTDSMTAVDMDREIDGYFYGKAVVAGDLVLEGPLEQLHLDLKLATKDGTKFKIPLDNPTAVESPSFLRFISDQKPNVELEQEQVELEYFTTDIAIEATDDAQLELVLDEVLGDIIKARGTGNLRLKLLEDESLELYGLYTVSSGNYVFTLQNIINKSFELLPGGTILWSGDLYEAEVDLEAKYSVSTDLEGLVSSSGYNNEDVEVNLIIELSGALMSPEIGFRVELPGAPASYEQELQRHFLTDDAMNYQAFSLLMLGDFYAQDLAIQENVTLGDYVSTNTSDMLVSEFGSWLAAGIGSYIDVELDYTSANPTNVLGTTNDNLNLGVSKDFFEGRLVVNSSLDIPINQSGASTLILGDTEVLYSVTKDGRVVLRAFNRSNRNDPLLQNTGPYTQGVGIMFQKEFDKVSTKSAER